jgi:prepilin-type N-terminal cleavage/methylation domain-containing protein/prepilin-type processing-associated H-X9-DG protein
MHRARKSAFTLVELLVVVALIATLAAILFPVFAQVREKGWQATCLSNLRQIGSAVAMYVQDNDERLPNCCWWSRGWTVWSLGQAGLEGQCAQEGITWATPKDSFLGPEQRPPRYIQELLRPYVNNGQLWFCPSVGKDRPLDGMPGVGTYAFNGTTYLWNHIVDPSQGRSEFSSRNKIQVSGLPIFAIPRPAEAPVLTDEPVVNPLKKPCISMDPKPAHARGLNALYADSHARFSPFTNQPSPGKPIYPCVEDWYADNHWKGFFE